MLHAFDFEIDNDSFLFKNPDFVQELNPDLKLINPVKKIINANPKKNSSEEDVIDYDDFVENWFPKTKAHVFISHSHNDKGKAIALANFLYTKFGIHSFVDSEVWGYLDDALLKLNQEYNSFPDLKDTYKYSECNKLSGNLNLILTSALAKMINDADALFFINTANSVCEDEGFKTNSPWIFTEILLSSMLKTMPHEDRPRAIRKEVIKADAMDMIVTESRKVSFSFPLGMKHMIKVTKNKLNKIGELEAAKTNIVHSFREDIEPMYVFKNLDIFKNLDAIYRIARS